MEGSSTDQATSNTASQPPWPPLPKPARRTRKRVVAKRAEVAPVEPEAVMRSVRASLCSTFCFLVFLCVLHTPLYLSVVSLPSAHTHTSTHASTHSSNKQAGGDRAGSVPAQPGSGGSLGAAAPCHPVSAVADAARPRVSQHVYRSEGHRPHPRCVCAGAS